MIHDELAPGWLQVGLEEFLEKVDANKKHFYEKFHPKAAAKTVSTRLSLVHYSFHLLFTIHTPSAQLSVALTIPARPLCVIFLLQSDTLVRLSVEPGTSTS